MQKLIIKRAIKDDVKTNLIYCGDCKKIMVNHIPDESIDLIYVDPPFFSDRHYEVLWGNGYEMRAFEDRWKGGIENYIAWMDGKLRECHRVLKSTGSMYLHCDWHAHARLRINMDKIFGKANIVNEIIWKRTSAHGDTKQGAKHFGRIHDTILLYKKGSKYKWNMEYTPYDEEYIEKFYKYIEPETGRHFQPTDLTAAKPGGDTKYSWKGVKPAKERYWAYSKENMEQFEREGRLYYPKGGRGMVRYKRYLDEMLGLPVQDIWLDIKHIHSKSKERFGYPTQKPEALLERIIKVSSNKNDIILDPMCGCGTAIAVAHKLKRRWVGIDISPTGCKLMVKRMRSLGVKISQKDIIGLPKTLEQIKALKPFEFQNWVCEKLLARQSMRKTGDMGIDGWLIDGRPLQVKQSERVGRNVVDNFETAIKRKNKKRGMIVAFSFGKGTYEEVARAKNKEGLEIELKTVKEIMDEI
jgi:DNA modification methylase